MKKADFAAMFPEPWGASADEKYMQFPVPASTTVTGRASLDLGFPPSTMTPPEAGGSYPFGADVNGGFRMCSTSARNYEAGIIPPYSASYAQEIGGYPLGARVADATSLGSFWISTADDNLTAPGASGAAWISLFAAYYTAVQSDAKYCPLTGFSAAGEIGAQGTTSWSTATTSYSNGVSLVGRNARYVSLRQSEEIGQYTQAILQVVGYSGVTTYLAFRDDGSLWSGNAQMATQAFATGTVAVSGNNWFWMKLPNGMLIQGGNASYSASDGINGTTVTLPTTFGASFIYAGGNDIGSNANSVTIMRINGSTIRLLGREVTTGTLQDTTINYLCVGTAP